MLNLVRDLSESFILPEFSEEAAGIFRSGIVRDTEKIFNSDQIQCFVAETEDMVVGFIVVRDSQYISRLFVSKEYHHQHIGTRLVQKIIDNAKMIGKIAELKVRSSTYAVPFYEKQGFKATDKKQQINGIIYTPMVLKIKC